MVLEEICSRRKMSESGISSFDNFLPPSTLASSGGGRTTFHNFIPAILPSLFHDQLLLPVNNLRYQWIKCLSANSSDRNVRSSIHQFYTLGYSFLPYYNIYKDVIQKLAPNKKNIVGDPYVTMDPCKPPVNLETFLEKSTWLGTPPQTMEFYEYLDLFCTYWHDLGISTGTLESVDMYNDIFGENLLSLVLLHRRLMKPEHNNDIMYRLVNKNIDYLPDSIKDELASKRRHANLVPANIIYDTCAEINIDLCTVPYHFSRLNNSSSSTISCSDNTHAAFFGQEEATVASVPLPGRERAKLLILCQTPQDMSDVNMNMQVHRQYLDISNTMSMAFQDSACVSVHNMLLYRFINSVLKIIEDTDNRPGSHAIIQMSLLLRDLSSIRLLLLLSYIFTDGIVLYRPECTPNDSEKYFIICKNSSVISTTDRSTTATVYKNLQTMYVELEKIVTTSSSRPQQHMEIFPHVLPAHNNDLQNMIQHISTFNRHVLMKNYDCLKVAVNIIISVSSRGCEDDNTVLEVIESDFTHKLDTAARFENLLNIRLNDLIT